MFNHASPQTGINEEIMDVLNSIIRNSSLKGMPKWYSATALLLFSAIVVSLLIMLSLLLVYGPQINIQFGY